MLKRDTLAQKLTIIAEKLFTQEKRSTNIVYKAWLELSKNDAFLKQVQQLQNQAVIPSWDGDLCSTVKIDPRTKDYTVLAVDGSQIYPDHHMADVGCFLINCGGCELSYGAGGRAQLFSEPEVFLSGQVLPKKYPVNFSPDLVDLKREELEFAMALTHSTSAFGLRSGRSAGSNDPAHPEPVEGRSGRSVGLNHPERALRVEGLTLFDGSLIFWHLEAKQKEVKDFFLKRYLEILEQFYQKKLFIAGYLSFPKSRELIRLVKVWLCQYLAPDGTPCKVPNPRCPCNAVDQMLDGQLMSKYLKKGFRTTIFHSHSKIIESYPDHLKPCFFYMNVGQEIARIELPAWIAQDRKAVDFISAVCLDQSSKGYGYPVALAEAHEQAVVTSRDREFFYHMIRKLGAQRNRNVLYSQKIVKKRGMKF